MADSNTAEIAPEPEPDITPPVVETVAAPPSAPEMASSSRFVPMVLGGAVAAALGFGAAYALAAKFPQMLGISGTAGLEQRLSDHDKRLTDLAAALAVRPTGAAGDSTALRADLDAQQANAVTMAQQQQALTDQLAALAAKVQTLESRPVGAGDVSAGDIAAAAQKAKAAEDEAARAQADAADMARKSAIQTALAQVEMALESGTAFGAELTQLSDANVAVPDALSAQAQGVPTMAALRAGFAPAARDALTASLAETAGGSFWNRTTAFLRSQTGARSLTPRAGSDPDAILSRAEAALGAGDLGAALTEVAALPPAGQARMAEWQGLAERRLAAAQAIAAMAAQVK